MIVGHRIAPGVHVAVWVITAIVLGGVAGAAFSPLLGMAEPRHDDSGASGLEVPAGSGIPANSNGTVNVTVLAPAFDSNPNVTYSFTLDGQTYNSSGGNATVLTNLTGGPHTISDITAGPAAPGWAYFGSASTGAIFSEPGTGSIVLTYSYVNLTLPTIQVSFAPTNLPLFTNWGLWFNGTQRMSNLGQIMFDVRPGWYESQFQSTSGGQGLVEYKISEHLNFSYYGNDSTIPLTYEVSFALTVYGAPGGIVHPEGISWLPPNTSVTLYAEGSAHYFFKSWTGSGPGNYSGEAPQHTLIIVGPVTEWAVFLPRPNTSGVVRFLESGLPNGTIWTVSLGGVGYSSGLNVLVVANLVPCTTGLAGDPGLYAIDISDVYSNLTTPGLSVRYVPSSPPGEVCGNSLPVVVTFETQFLVLTHASPGGTATAWLNGTSVGGTYVSPGAMVQFYAGADYGFGFSGWSGVGGGSANSSALTVSITIVGSIDEYAAYFAIPDLLGGGFPLTFTISNGAVLAPIWSVTVDGQAYAANGTQLVVPDVPAGNHSVAIPPVLDADGVSRSVSSTSQFVVAVAGPTQVNISFTTWYWLDVKVYGPGRVIPSSGWFPVGANVTLTATPDSGAALVGWASTTETGYQGTNATAVVVMSGAVEQSITFVQNAPPPDFWHRASDLLISAAGAFVVGVLAAVLFFRRRRRPRLVSPPPGAAKTQPPSPEDGSGTPSAIGSPRTLSPEPKVGVALLVLLLLLGTLPGVGAAFPSSGHSTGVSPPELVPRIAAADAPGAVSATSGAPVPGGARSAPQGVPFPESAGPTLNFSETGLPANTRWNVSVWPFNSSESAPLTVSGRVANLTIPLSVYYTAVDFSIWEVPIPSSPSSAWFGTANVSAPLDTYTTTHVGVTFAVGLIDSQSFRFHLVETGLPAKVPWNISLQGVGYAVNPPSVDSVILGGKGFIFDASTMFQAPNEQYLPAEISIERLILNSTWQNATSGPIIMEANESYWISVSYRAQYRVHVLGDYGGSVSPSTGWYAADVRLNLSATPAVGYKFSNWTGNGTGAVNSTNSEIVVTPMAPLDEIASFVAIPYTITVEETGIPAGETYSVVYNGAIYSSNASSFVLPVQTVGNVTVSIPFVPAALTVGERFVPVGLNSTFPSGPNSTFFVAANGTFSVRFATQYALTLSASGPGTIAPAPGSYWEAAGGFVSILATSTPGNSSLALERWSGLGAGSYSGSLPGILVDMIAPITEAALFGPLVPGEGAVLTVVSAGLPGGTSWSAAVGPTGIRGTSSTLELGPFTGGPISLTVPTVLGAPGVRYAPEGGGVYRFGVTANTTYVVTFATQFEVNISVEFGGMVEPYPAWVDQNATLSVLVPPPPPGYNFDGWSGTTNSSAAFLTITVEAPVHLDALFSTSSGAGSAGPRDLQIVAAILGIPAAAGIILAWLWLRRGR